MWLIAFLFTSLQVFAIYPQEGGGGNVCISKRSQRLVLLDSLSFSESRWRQAGIGRESLILSETHGNHFETDLTKLKHARWVDVGLRNFAEKERDISNAFYRIFQTFNHVRVTDSDGEMALEPDSALLSLCVPGTIRRAFLSYFGLYQISQPLWNQLSGSNQRQLLIHEIIRNMQILIGDDMISNRALTHWSVNLGEHSFDDTNLYETLLAIDNKFDEVRKRFRGQARQEVFQKLEDNLTAAVSSDDLPLAFQAYREIVIYDLATHRGKREVPLYRNNAYIHLVKRKTGLF